MRGGLTPSCSLGCLGRDANVASLGSPCQLPASLMTFQGEAGVSALSPPQS